MLPHAPGVQMANIPEDGVTLKEESEAADEADPDKRNPQQLKDKQIEPDNEFDDAAGKSGNRDESSAAKDVEMKKETSAAAGAEKAAANKEADEPMEVDETKTEDKKETASATAAASS